MKNKIFYIVVLFLFFGISQAQDYYIFNVGISDRTLAPDFNFVNSTMVYSGQNQDEVDFFSNYTIIDFYQTYPDSNREQTLNVFTFIVVEDGFINQLMARFPKYVFFEDLTGIEVELLDLYTDDYGTTSPFPSVLQQSLSQYDYIGVPKAWEYSNFGSNKVFIGISDAKINESDIEFLYKTQYLQAYTDIYSNAPYSLGNQGSHGNTVTAIAAAQGDNSHGMVGVCSNCSIIANAYLYGNTSIPDLNRLLQLAIAGSRVINMSWAWIHTVPINSQQWIFDELYEDYGVVCVAGAGNSNPYNADYAPNYNIYGFPASYNHVISVSSVNHKNKNFLDEVEHYSWWPDVSYYNQDLITPQVLIYPDGSVHYTNYLTGQHSLLHTINDKVDIVAPGDDVFLYSRYDLNNTVDGKAAYYGSGTSSSAPHVTGTVGLMFSVNDCLYADEVEDILQLTSKNIESNIYNNPFIGRIGSGKLETGDAVEFVYEAMQPDGNAVISGQDFWRFEFTLRRINYKLTISNQIFRDFNRSYFSARKEIEVLSNSDFHPNSDGYIDLNVNPDFEFCDTPPYQPRENRKTLNLSSIKETKILKLFPNPNSGVFELSLNNLENDENKLVEIYSLNGVKVFEKTLSNNNSKIIQLDVQNLAKGLYLLKYSSASFSDIIKFTIN